MKKFPGFHHGPRFNTFAATCITGDTLQDSLRCQCITSDTPVLYDFIEDINAKHINNHLILSEWHLNKAKYQIVQWHGFPAILLVSYFSVTCQMLAHFKIQDGALLIIFFNIIATKVKNEFKLCNVHCIVNQY